MKAFLRLVMCLGFFLVLPVQAQLRSIPENALRADMELVSSRVVKLDGDSYALSVGAQIYNTNNMLVLTQALDSGVRYAVRVQISEQKEVMKVWMLTEAEAAAKAPLLNPKKWFWPF